MPVAAVFNLGGLTIDSATQDLVGTTIRLAFSATSAFLNSPCDWALACDGEQPSTNPPPDLTSFQWNDTSGPTFATFPLGKVFGPSLPFAGLSQDAAHDRQSQRRSGRARPERRPARGPLDSAVVAGGPVQPRGRCCHDTLERPGALPRKRQTASTSSPT